MISRRDAYGSENEEPLTNRGSLGMAKEARRRAEIDAQLLANRIALLKQEEEKALKKINETKRKAEEYAKIRREAEARERQRLAIELKRQQDAEKTLERSRKQRELARDRKMHRVDNGSLMHQAKLSAARETKEVLDSHLASKMEETEMEKQKLAERTDNMRKQREAAKLRLDRERMAKLETFKLNYAGRVAEEEAIRRRTEELVAEMERQELELIKRLEEAQKGQKAVEAELEKARTRKSPVLNKN